MFDINNLPGAMTNSEKLDYSVIYYWL